MANNLTAVISANTDKFVQEVKAAQHMLDKFVKEQKNATSGSKANQTVTNEQVAAYQRVIKALDKVASGTMKTKQQEKALVDQIKELKIQWANLSDTAKSSDFGKSLSDSMKQASSQLKLIRTQLKQVGNEIENTKNKAKGGFKFDLSGFKQISSAGLGMVAGVGSIAAGVSMAIGALKDGVKTTMDFNTKQSELQAVTMKSKEELKGLTEQALDLGAKTRYSASEIAGLQIELAKLGFNPQEIENMTEHVQNLATALGSDLSETASLAGATLRMFGLATEDTQKVSDVLAASCSKSALSFEFLNSAMSTVGPVANAFGMSLEDTVGILGILANAGFDASSSATAARNIFLNLADANGKLAKSFGKPVTSGKEMMDALKTLKDKGIDLATALELTDKRSVAAFNTLLDGSESGKELITALEGCAGAAKDMSDIMSDNLEGDLASLNSAWEGFMLKLGGGQDLFRQVVQWLTKLVNKVSEVAGAIADWATDLYDNSIVVRAILQTIVVGFKSTFDAIVTIVKMAMNGISSGFKVIGKALEGDFEGAYHAWKEGVSKQVDIWNAGNKKIRQNDAEGIEAIIKGRKKLTKAIQEENKKSTQVVSNVVTSGGTTTSGVGIGKGNTKKVKVEAEDDTLDYWKDYLNKLQKQLTSKKLSPIDVEKVKKEIEDVKKKISQKELELGIKPKEGSLEWVDDQIREVETKLKKLNPQVDIVEIEELKVKKEALEKTKKDIESTLNTVVITGKKFESNGKVGSQQYASDKVNYYKQKLSLEIEGTEEYNYLAEKLKEWTEKEHEIKLKVEEDLSSVDKNSLKYFDNKISKLQAELEVTAYGTPEYIKIKKELDQWTNKKQTVEYSIELDKKKSIDKFKSIEGAFGGIDGVVGSMQSMAEAIEEGANAWEIFMNVLNMVDSVLGAISDTIEAVNTITHVLGQTTQATTQITTAAAAQSAVNAETEVASSVATTAAKSGEAIAGATASGAKLPFPANIAAIAAGIAAVIAALAMIGSFANGGIIQGSTTIGDYNLARVNSGEMILNGRQQNNLFKAIDENRLGGGGTIVGGEVKIKGSDLYIALKNYSKVKGALGKQTGII